MLNKIEDDDEDVEALFNSTHPFSNFLNESDSVNRLSSANKSKPGTAMRLGTSSGVSFLISSKSDPIRNCCSINVKEQLC